MRHDLLSQHRECRIAHPINHYIPHRPLHIIAIDNTLCDIRVCSILFPFNLHYHTDFQVSTRPVGNILYFNCRTGVFKFNTGHNHTTKTSDRPLGNAGAANTTTGDI